MKKETDRQISIRFSPSLFAWIDIQAKENKRSFNAQVLWMLEQLQQQEKGKK